MKQGAILTSFLVFALAIFGAVTYKNSQWFASSLSSFSPSFQGLMPKGKQATPYFDSFASDDNSAENPFAISNQAEAGFPDTQKLMPKANGGGSSPAAAAPNFSDFADFDSSSSSFDGAFNEESNIPMPESFENNRQQNPPPPPFFDGFDDADGEAPKIDFLGKTGQGSPEDAQDFYNVPFWGEGEPY